MSNPLSGYAAIAKQAQDLLKERDAEIALLKAQLAEQTAQGERLQALAAKFQGEADDANARAEHWEQEYRSLERDYYRRP